MSIKDDLIGSKGGSSTFRNRPDNLRSTDTFEALIGLCSGRIKGLAPGGLKNLMVDDVPIEDGSGNTTLTDFNAILFDGDPTILQPIQLQLGGSSGAQNVNLPLNNSNQGAGTGSPGEWRFGTVPQGGVDYIDLRFIINGLFRQDKKGIYDATASIEIELQPSGSSQWINPLASVAAPTYNSNGIKLAGYSGVSLYVMESMYATSNTWYDPAPGYLQVTGKTSQAYVKEIRIAVPNTGNYANKTWQVRARLRERDSYTNDQDQESRSIQWESLAGVSMAPIGDREEWRGLAYLHVNGKASDQLSGVPTITGIYDLSTVRVPPASVWDAASRVYTGATWDGATEEVQWTQCPAFQLKDLVEDGVSGISALVPGSTVNKWDVLEASKWYAQRVPDGQGGTQPRYAMNFLLDSALSVNDLMQYVAGAVGSYAWDEGDGKWRLMVEKPENATAIFTKENIVGEFGYSHTDVDSRYNDMVGVYRSEARGFEEDRVRVFDQAHIDNFGRRATSVALVGCTNRQEALRRLKIRQLTSLNETRQVSFLTNRQGSMVQPFSVILIADGDLAGDTSIRTTGRLVANTGTNLTVRDTMRLELGISYKVHVTIPNPDYNPASTAQPGSPDWRKPTITITRNVTNAANARGDVTGIQIDSALPANTPKNAPIALEAVGLPTLPKQYRVLDVEYQDEEMISISAIEIYTNKWNESDAVNESDILAQRPNKIIPSPTIPENGMFSVKSYPAEFQTKRVLSVTWDRPGSIWIDGFKVEFNLNNGPWQTLTENTQDNYVELQQPQNGLYTFRIATIDRRGGYSTPLISSYQLEDTAADYAPIQTRGLLRDRPTAGGREGDKYTTTDQSPNITFIWSAGQWYDESTYVKDAGDIQYVNPVTGAPIGAVNDLKPAEPGATEGAPVGTNIGGRPVTELLGQVDKSVIDIDKLVADFGDFDTDLSDQVDAATQAAAVASQAANDATAAKNLANTAQIAAGNSAGQSATSQALSDEAKRLAEVAQGLAQAAKTAAETAQTAAKANADAAAVSKSGAEGFATTASGYATVATQQAEGATQSASTATGQADIARTKAGEASVSSDRAAASESNALGSANSASTSSQLSATALTATQALFNASYPPSLDTMGRKAYTFERPVSSFIGPDVTWPTPLLANWDDANMAGMSTQFGVGFSKFVPKVVGRRYRALVWIYSGATNASFSASWRDFAYEDGTGNRFLGAGVGTANAVQVITPVNPGFFRVGCEYVVTDSNQAFLQFYLTIGSSNGQPINGRVHMGPIEFVDITESAKAGVAASAAFDSAQTAAASSTDAGTKAAASDASRVKAETAQGLAESAKAAAALSESNAQGSASTATTQAGLAATAKTGAEGFAKASSDSATIATAKASESELSASTSDSARIAAETAKGLAEGYKNTAVSASDSATASKTAASLSEGIAVSAKNATQALLNQQFPPTLNSTGRGAYFLLGDVIGPDSAWPQPYITQIPINTFSTEVTHRFLKPIPKVVGKIYRYTAWVFGYGNNTRFFTYWYDGPNEATIDRALGFTGSDITPTGPGWNKLVGEFTIQDVHQPFIWPTINLVLTNGTTNNGQIHVTGIVLEDITESKNAGISANAAVGSAAAALASEDAAGQKASASEASRIKAETAQGLAESAKAAAALSESSASGSSSSAAESNRLAGLAKDAAGQSAAASLLSSGTASGSATAAELSASAAETARASAVTAQGASEAARDTAVTSKDTAAGSAAAAATSASLAATAQGGAQAALARQLPSILDPAGRLAYNYAGEVIGPSGDWPHPYITQIPVNTFSGETYLQFTKNMLRAPGRRYTIRAFGFSYATNVIFFLGLYGSNAEVGGADAYYGTLSNNGSIFKPAGPGFFALTGTWDTEVANARSFYSPRLVTNVDNGQPNNGVVHLTGIEIVDVTESKAAEGFANASSGSAAAALASSGLAGNYSETARGYRDEAFAFNGTASTSAANAQTYANQANASSASASSSAVIASSYSSSSVNVNDKFANWTDVNAYPAGYVTWVAEGNYSFNRQPGIGSAYAIQTKNDSDGVTSGFVQGTKVWAGKWVMEATVRLDAGNYQGAGLSINGFYNLNFSTTADSVGDVSISKTNEIRSFSYMFDITPAFIGSGGSVNVSFHSMHGWTGFGTIAAKYLTWYMVRLRPATQPEIDAGKAIANAATNAARIESVNSTITTDLGALGQRTESIEVAAGLLTARTGLTETAVVNLSTGQAAARLEFVAQTAGGVAQVTLRSDNNAGAAVEIIGNVSISGQKLTNGTVEPGKLNVAQLSSITADIGTITAGILKSADGSASLDLTTKRLSFTTGNYRLVEGVALGPNSNMVLWYGPNSIAAGSETIGNSKFCLATDGKVYNGAAELTNGGAALQTVGYNTQVTKVLDPGASVSFSGSVFVEGGGQGGTLYCQIVGGPQGGAQSVLVQGAGGYAGPNEPGGDTVSGSFTNNSSTRQIFSFYVTRTPTNVGGTLRASQSYLTI